MNNKINNELIEKLDKHGAHNPGLDYFVKLFEKSSYFKNKEIDSFIENTKKDEPFLFKASLPPEQVELYNKSNNEKLKREMLKKLWGFNV